LGKTAFKRLKAFSPTPFPKKRSLRESKILKNLLLRKGLFGKPGFPHTNPFLKKQEGVPSRNSSFSERGLGKTHLGRPKAAFPKKIFYTP